jgi:hypothetical protein
MTRLLLAAAALGTLTGLALTYGTGGAVGVAVSAGGVIVWCLVRAIQTDRRRQRDKARHPSTIGNVYISIEPRIDTEPLIRAQRILRGEHPIRHQRRFTIIKGDKP